MAATVESAFVLLDRASGPIRGIRRELRELEADARKAGRAMDELSGPRMARQMETQARELRNMGSEADTTGRKLDNAERSMSTTEKRLASMAKSTKEASIQWGALGKMLALLKWPAIIAGIGGVIQALGGLAGGVVALLPKLADLSGAAAFYGTTMIGAGAAMGVAKLATHGLSQALAGNKKALADLTPEGRRFLSLIKSMRPELKALRDSAQAGLLPGLGNLLRSVRSEMPQIRGIIRQTAGDLGGLGTFLGQQITQPGFMRDLRALADQGGRSFGSAARGGFYFAQALEQVLLAASPLTDWLGSTLVHLGKMAEQEAFVARQTGQLGSFFDRTKKAIQTMADIGRHAFDGLRGVMEAARGTGDSLWGSIDRVARRFDQWTNSVTGQTRMRTFFDEMRPVLHETVGLVGDLAKGFASLTQGQQGAQMMQALRDAVPAIVSLIRTLTTSFGPAVVQAFGAVGTLIGDISGAGGPMTLVARAVGSIASAADKLLKLLGPLGPALAQTFGVFALAKKMGIFDVLDRLILKWKGVGAAASQAATMEDIAMGGTGRGATPVPVAAGTTAAERQAARTAAQGGSEAESLILGAGAGAAGSAAYLRARGALSGEQAFTRTYGNAGADLVGEGARGARYGAPVLGELSAAGGVADAGVLARLGGVGGKLLGFAGKFAAPLAAIQAILGFAGTQGDVGDRSLGGLNAATFGLGGRALNTLSFGVIPSAPISAAQRRTAGGQYAANVIQGLGTGNSLAAQRRAVSHLRTGLRLLPGNDAFDQNTHDLHTATSLLQRELKRREAILAASVRATNEALDRQSILHAQTLVGNFTQAFAILAHAQGPEKAMQETVAHVLERMSHLRKSGQMVLGDAMLAWAHQQARDNPKLEAEYERLVGKVKDDFTGLGKHIAVVNDQILTGSKTEWQNIAAALTNPVEQARQQVTKGFTAIQQQAIGSLTAMGYSASQARQVVQGIASGTYTTAQVAQRTGAGQPALASQMNQRANFSLGTTVKRHASGGRLPGTGTLDTVRLVDGSYGAPGELVVNHWTERDVNRDLARAGAPSLEQRVRGETRPHYRMAVSGRIGVGASSVASSHPELHAGIAAAVQQVLNRFPLAITSTTGGGHAAGSYHYRGEAADIAGPASTMLAAANWIKTSGLAGSLTEGIHNPNLSVKFGRGVPSSYWGPAVWGEHANHIHMAVAGALAAIGGAGFAGGNTSSPSSVFAAQQIRALTAPTSTLGGVPGALVNRAGALYAAGLTGQLNKHLSNIGIGGNFAGVPGGGGTSGQNQALGRAMMIAAGYGPDQWPYLKMLWTKESGWNANARNPTSGAAGIPQDITGNMHGGARGQIAWGINYIRGRYGTPAAAWAHEQAHNWYARGGRIGWGGWNAAGGDFIVRRPTLFGAGEGSQPERVTIGPAHGRGVTIQSGAVQINATGDTAAVQRYVEKRLERFAAEVADELEHGDLAGTM